MSRATLLEVKELNEDAPAMPALVERFLAQSQTVESMEEGSEKEARRSLLTELGAGIHVDRLRREHEIDQLTRGADDPARLARYHFVPFGDRFILHPGDFVLGITFEWMKLPSDLGGSLLESRSGVAGVSLSKRRRVSIPGSADASPLKLGM